MNMVYKSLGYLKNMYNQLNPATLTGAIDIVVIEQEDGTLLASPFHVRFGKLGVLRAKEKLVKITVNDERIPDLHMKLGDQGEAFFVQEVVEEEEIPQSLITSPIPSRPNTPSDKDKLNENKFDGDEFQLFDEHGKRKRRKKRKKRAVLQAIEDDSEAVISCSDNEDKPAPEEKLPHDNQPRTSSESSSGKARPRPLVPELRLTLAGRCKAVSDDQQLPIHGFLSDSEVRTSEGASVGFAAPFSDSEANNIHHSQSEVMWGWGELPAANEPVRDSDDSSSHEGAPAAASEQPETTFRNLAPEELDDNPIIENNKPEQAIEPTLPDQVAPSNSKPTPNLNGLYLDDVLNLNPTEANLYLHQPTTKSNKDAGPGTAPMYRTASPAGGSDIDSGTDSQTQEEAVSQDPLIGSLLSGSRLSLCGIISGAKSVDEVKFRDKEVSFDAFLQNPGAVLNDPNLVVKLGDRYMNWQTAAPALVLQVVYKQPLTKEHWDHLLETTQTPQSKGIYSWFWRKPKQSAKEITAVNGKESDIVVINQADDDKRIRTTTESSEQNTEDEVAKIMHNEKKRSRSSQNSSHGSHNQFVFTSTTTISGGKLMRKTTRLSSQQLVSLKLKEGANKIVFSVTSQYQGTSRCQASIYRWKWSDKIVVSDIDGTITKSDVFGQILPVVGKDWTQSGVAKLYQNIGKNGYKFMYLSARAIGQASMTKGYLNWINQQGVSLPPGPLFLSPTSLMIAFRREVIEKRPEKFKIDCLTDIKALFPADSNPFSAGFGNKTSDVTSYQAVGIPNSRMFTVNHKGELRHEKMQTYKTSYRDLGDAVDHFFPPLHPRNDLDLHDDSFTDFSFWRDNHAFDQFNDFALN